MAMLNYFLFCAHFFIDISIIYKNILSSQHFINGNYQFPIHLNSNIVQRHNKMSVIETNSTNYEKTHVYATIRDKKKVTHILIQNQSIVVIKVSHTPNASYCVSRIFGTKTYRQFAWCRLNVQVNYSVLHSVLQIHFHLNFMWVIFIWILCSGENGETNILHHL